EDYAYAISVDKNGDICITGCYSGTIDFDPGPGQYKLSTQSGYKYTFIAKYTSNGNLIFAKHYQNYNNAGYSIKTDHNANIYIGGYFQGTEDKKYIMKL